MEEHTHPILCGGTFFTLLLQAIKQRTKTRDRDEGGSDNLNDQNVLIGLIKVFEPNYEPPKKSSMKTITSNFKNCKTDTSAHLPFTDPAYIEAYDRCIKNDYQSSLMAMSSFVDNFIDVVSSIEKHEWLVRSLLELVALDQKIGNDQPLYICPNGQSIRKAEFLEISGVCLPAFLLGIWHFIVVDKQDNAKGGPTLKKWYEESEEKMKGKSLIGITGASIKRLINVYTLDEDIPNANGINESILNSDDTQKHDTVINYDDSFDLHVMEFYRVLRLLIGAIRSENVERTDTAFRKFVTSYENIVSNGRRLNNAINECRVFIEKIAAKLPECEIFARKVAMKEMAIDEHFNVTIYELVKQGLSNDINKYLAFKNGLLNETLLKSTTPPEKMLILFKQAIRKYGVAGFVTTGDPDLSYNMAAFDQDIETQIFQPFINSKNETIYEKIKEFTEVFFNYYRAIYVTPTSTYSIKAPLLLEYEGNNQDLLTYKNEALDLRQKLNDIYAKICNGEALLV